MSQENASNNEGTVLKNTAAGGEPNKESPNTGATETKEHSAVEKQAMEQGWRPQDEWDGDPAEWRDARSFLDRGELLTRISQQSKEMKRLRETLKAFEAHNKQLAETKFTEKLNSLKVEKKEALEAGDAARVVELDEQIDLVKDSLAENKASTIVTDEAAPEVHPAFTQWVEKNNWYAQNAEMRAFADEIGTAHAKTNRDKTPQEVLKWVENRVKMTYKDHFLNSNRETPNRVEGGEGIRKQTPVKRGHSEADLPPEAREVMNTLVRSGTMTKDEYVKQYFIKG